MKIAINNLILKGKHGTTKEEKSKSQTFKVNISVETIKNYLNKDNLRETLDYKKCKKIAKKVIENSNHNLLETLANKIARKIIGEDRVFSAEVGINKLDVWDNGTPFVSVKLFNSPNLDLLDFDLDKMINELLLFGGTSVPIIPEKRRVSLEKEAEKYEYQKQPEVVGKHKVREELSSFQDFPENSLFIKLQEDFIDLLNYKLSLSKLKPFGTNPISFNEGVLQKYEKGSLGITTHMDGLSCRNLVLVFTIKGKGELYLCDDRERKNSRLLDTSPGNVTILRAPGFFGSNKRPFHYLTNITKKRITFGLRLNTRLFK